MKATLTQREKADRYDSLQMAISNEKRFLESLIRDYRLEEKKTDHVTILSAYNKGKADGYASVVEDLKRWIL